MQKKKTLDNFKSRLFPIKNLDKIPTRQPYKEQYKQQNHQQNQK